MAFKVAFIILVLSLQSLVKSQTLDKDPIMNYAALEKPFRMQKVNLVWEKARVKLSDSKLKLLHYELKLHDKEEVALKKLKADVGDKDGLREAEVRKRFNSILNHYGLGGKAQDHTTDGADVKSDNMRLFKDKKLDRLWQKAKVTGMDEEELMLLKKEFQHYQEKVDTYHRLMEISGKDPLAQNRRRNGIDDLEDFDDIYEDTEESQKHVNAIDGDQMKADLKKQYKRLKQMSTDSNAGKSFEEPKVNGLWKLAQEAEFSPEELESLRIELKHYEHRIQKLHQMKAELSFMEEQRAGEGQDGDFRKRMDKKMKKHAETVNAIHSDLQRKIIARHSEL